MKQKQKKSFGVIPVFKNPEGDFLFCIVLASAGHWGFPKGHQDLPESEEETALRELEEETGIKNANIVKDKSFTERYVFKRDGFTNNKFVKYFLGFITSISDATPDNFKEEIPELRWVNYKEAKNLLSFKERIEILDEAFKYLNAREK